MKLRKSSSYPARGSVVGWGMGSIPDDTDFFLVS
jgi:hypothetical protein